MRVDVDGPKVKRELPKRYSNDNSPYHYPSEHYPQPNGPETDKIAMIPVNKPFPENKQNIVHAENYSFKEKRNSNYPPKQKDEGRGGRREKEDGGFEKKPKQEPKLEKLKQLTNDTPGASREKE